MVTFLPKFIWQRVDVNVILAASDQDLLQTGISAFNDRCRLRSACRRKKPYSISSSIVIMVFNSSSQTQDTITAHHVIVMVLPYSFHRFGEKDLWVFVFLQELDATADQHQLVVPAEIYSLLIYSSRKQNLGCLLCISSWEPCKLPNSSRK